MVTITQQAYHINETLFPPGRVKLHDKVTGRSYIYDDVLAVYKVSYVLGSGYQLHSIEDVSKQTPVEDLAIYDSEDYEVYFEGWTKV